MDEQTDPPPRDPATTPATEPGTVEVAALRRELYLWRELALSYAHDDLLAEIRRHGLGGYLHDG